MYGKTHSFKNALLSNIEDVQHLLPVRDAIFRKYVPPTLKLELSKPPSIRTHYSLS